MKTPLGSIVYYMGEEWINECIIHQPVFGISRYDKKRPTNYSFRFKKTFSQYLRETIIGEQKFIIKSKQKKNINKNNLDVNKIDIYV